MLVAGTGILCGLAIALLAGRLLRSVLFEVSPSDPLAMIGACGLLLLVAGLAALVPARRATRVDPAQVLRAE
jgi:ABC-type antimicrobial peptide transport system permease subunit